jgi:hypothetical protein
MMQDPGPRPAKDWQGRDRQTKRQPADEMIRVAACSCPHGFAGNPRNR